MPIGARTAGIEGRGYQRLDLSEGDTEQRTPEPCQVRKCTVAEALRDQVKLPWDDKVEKQAFKSLTKELFLELSDYGLTRMEIMRLFRADGHSFYKRLSEWGIPDGQRGQRNTNRRKNWEVGSASAPVVTEPEPAEEPAKVLGEMDLDVELAAVEAKIAALSCDEAELPPDVLRPPLSYEDEIAGSEQAERDELLAKAMESGHTEQIGYVFDPAEEDLVDEDAAAIERDQEELKGILLQGAREIGRFPEIGLRIGMLVDDKQAQYGDSISSMGPILRHLYPDGIGTAQYDDLGLIVRIIDKIKRITLGNGQGGEDAWSDIAGYGLLGSARQQYQAEAVAE